MDNEVKTPSNFNNPVFENASLKADSIESLSTRQFLPSGWSARNRRVCHRTFASILSEHSPTFEDAITSSWDHDIVVNPRMTETRPNNLRHAFVFIQAAPTNLAPFRIGISFDKTLLSDMRNVENFHLYVNYFFPTGCCVGVLWLSTEVFHLAPSFLLLGVSDRLR
jgi:hypothetical protein